VRNFGLRFAIGARPVMLWLAILFVTAFAAECRAQDDVTTQNGSSALNGGWITGPASNPLSLLNGPAYRTFGNNAPYDFPDFHPVTSLDRGMPRWIAFQAEERLRFEGYRNGAFQSDNDDDYMLNRLRVQVDLRPALWMRWSAQVQDARPMYQKPPYGPPNQNRWDLRLAYAEFGNPARHWISVRVGRQIINYNNTIIASSEWRNQSRAYDAVVTNFQKGGFHLGIFAASIVSPQASGISHHIEGNNIYGIYGRFSSIIPRSDLEPFVLWRLQPKVVIDPAVSNATGKQDLRAFGVRWKGQLNSTMEYSVEGIKEVGRQGSEPISAWGTSDGIAYQSRWKAQPRIFSQFDYASGNDSPSPGTHRTFDAVYSTTHDRFGIADVFGWQNIWAIRGGGTIRPRSRLTLTMQYINLNVAAAHDAVYSNSGSVIGVASPAFGKRIGGEGDVYSWYEINRHFNLGGGYSWLRSGNLLRQITGASSYSSYFFAFNFKDNGKSE
jgi:hypothetical protein